MDRHAATRRLHRLVEAAGVRIAQHAPARRCEAGCRPAARG
jgi:hypothetical protein